jgi:outer membrane protein OmpA-like peptidoglycan-associated protein
MVSRMVLIAAGALLVLPGLSRAQDPPYADAWDPAAETAAQAAVAKLGPNRGLDLVPRVLAIRGLEVGVAGRGSGIVATVQEVQQAMKDLGATETDLEVRVELPADVLFDFDKADIRSDAASALAQLATLIRAYPSGSATLEGHTDSKGNDAYNQRLSERRAESVKRWLVEREGIEAGRLTPKGWGETKPVAGNDDDAGRQKNRRVEVVIRKQ